MERAAMATLVIFAVLVSLATLFASGDACNNVPSMTWEDACLKSRDKQELRWYQLCQDTLRTGPNTAQVTSYVLTATRKTLLRYDNTMSTIDQMMLQSGNGNLPAMAAKPSLEHCKERYGKARDLVAKIMDQLSLCDSMAVKQEFYDAPLGIQACQSELWSEYRSSPVYAAVSGDLDLTMVAFELGALLVDGK